MDALILIDFQNEWITANSEYYVGDLSELILRTNTLIDFARANGFKIIFTRHVEEEGDAFTGHNSELMSAFNIEESDILVVKHRISPFYKTNMETYLEGVDNLFICGILTNLCVRSMVSDAYDRDFNISLITDCCASFDEETHNFTLQDLKNTREEINLVLSSEVVN
jgi:nicotinamidase-related amidase